MVRRVAILFVLLLMLAVPAAFPLSDSCTSFDCYTVDNDMNEFCQRLLDGSGRFGSCTTIRQCAGGGDCITYCQYSSCYWV